MAGATAQNPFSLLVAARSQPHGDGMRKPRALKSDSGKIGTPDIRTTYQEIDMSYHNGLSFDTLRGANAARLPTFRNARGEIAHTKHDGSDWSPGDWMTAVVGELGEAANIMKKLRRGDYGDEGSEANIAAHEALAREFADVVTYLDILAMQFTVDLGKAVRVKFNEVSKRVGSPVYIGGDGDWHVEPTTPAPSVATAK